MKVKLNFDIQPQPGDCLIDNKQGTGNVYLMTKEGYLKLINDRKSNNIKLTKGTILYKVSHTLLDDTDVSAISHNNTEFTIL